MSDFLTNQLLIAMPSLDDPNFSHTVTFICEHNADGALGVVINRPSDLRLKLLLEHLDLEARDQAIADTPIYSGGPVQPDRGFVLHEPVGNWEATLKVSDDIGITASRDILSAIADGKGPQHSLIALGYAGWGAGQLEREIVDNAWLNGPADEQIVFEAPADERWKMAAKKLGIDLDLLSGDAGHA